MAKPKRTPPVAQPTPPQDARPAKAAAPTPAPFPIAHYLSRVPIQSAAVLFVLLQAANMNSPSKVTSVSAFIDVLVADPIPVLIVSVAGLGFVQAWFGTWARTTRRAALGLDKKKEVPVTEPAKEKTGFLGAFKSMGWNVLKGKPKQGIGRSAGAPKLDLNFNVSLACPCDLGKDLTRARLLVLGSRFARHSGCSVGLARRRRSLGSVPDDVRGFSTRSNLTSDEIYFGNSQVPETLLLCCVVAVLAIGPIAVAVEPTEQFVWLRLFSSMEYVQLLIPHAYQPPSLTPTFQTCDRPRIRTARPRCRDAPRLLGRRHSHSSRLG